MEEIFELCTIHNILHFSYCKECEEAEMIKFGHFVPTKEWEENASGANVGKLTGEELEEKLKELY